MINHVTQHNLVIESISKLDINYMYRANRYFYR